MYFYKGKDIRQIVNDSEWQAIRESFIGTWKKTPDSNVSVLRKYLGDMSDEMKLVRVLNYLTGSGFRMGVIGNVKSNELLGEVKFKLKEINHAI